MQLIKFRAIVPVGEHLTPRDVGFKRATEYANKASALQEQREIKTFFYKLEGVRGGIVAIKK